MSNTVQIVLALYDPQGTYCRHVGVLVTSLFAHTRSRVRVTLLHDATLTEDNRSRLLRTAEKFGQSIEFLDVSETVLALGEDLDRIARQYSKGSLYRLLIPRLFDREKVIYLDCDIAVNLDIAELWAVDVGDVSLAAVPDSESCIKKRSTLNSRLRSLAMRYDAQNYFNSGVLVMNLRRIREKYDLAEEAVRFFDRYRHCIKFPDQDFLNVLFRGDVRLIDGRFNRIGEFRDIDDSIQHLTGHYKPWVAHRCAPRDYFYWHTFAESEWRDQLVDAMMETYRDNPFAHHHTSDCFRRIGNRWKKDIFVHNIFARGFHNLRLALTALRSRPENDRR